ncbi:MULTISPECIES: hypothetical protein [unclassified Sphingomonas]|uniref:hypothetical protein n=1 Tax=unclassified Sphingomonas TaxID=196159 RepID=UPI00215177FB|nr:MULTISPECIES: hypothetical protein [unclassified Sphingomonas]MCR5869912.1 hypothetical protein [Sphingomonas sp. J344]UUX98391.1 hypothetical protein LRS08_12490 [Sphingomonas sp. J315]
MRAMVAVLAGAALLLPVSAQAMSVAEFLARANALKAKGFLALGSPDIKLLKGEMEGVATAYRADIVAARQAGRTPHSCPPPKGKANIGSKELLAEFRIDSRRPTRHERQIRLLRHDEEALSLSRLRFSPATPGPAAAGRTRSQ